MLDAIIPRLCESPHVCITCRDEAVPVRVIELLEGGLAQVERSGEIETVDIELCDAAVGDTVLVHAGVALARLNSTS